MIEVTMGPPEAHSRVPRPSESCHLSRRSVAEKQNRYIMLNQWLQLPLPK